MFKNKSIPHQLIFLAFIIQITVGLYHIYDSFVTIFIRNHDPIKAAYELNNGYHTLFAAILMVFLGLGWLSFINHHPRIFKDKTIVEQLLYDLLIIISLISTSVVFFMMTEFIIIDPSNQKLLNIVEVFGWIFIPIIVLLALLKLNKRGQDHV